MERIDVLIFVEHVARELDIACAIRHRLQQDHGLRVEIASYCHSLPETLGRYRPSVVVVPYCYSREDAGMWQVWRRWRDFKVVNLAFEQLLSDGNKPFKRPRDTMSRTEVLHLAAGEQFRQYLESHGVEPSNIAMVGSLSCGAYRLPYREYFETDRALLAKEHGLDAKRPWIFFPENFGAAFFTEREIRRRIRQGMNAESLQEYCASTRRALFELTQWCQRAAVETDAEIILRPRPATPQQLLADTMEANLGQKPPPRFHIIKSGSVREWILASDHTVSNYSSSLVEAAIAGKRTALLVPFPLPASMHCEWHEHATRVTSCEQFIELARDRHEGSSSLRRWTETQLLNCGDPIANTAETIAKVTNGRRLISPVTPPGAVPRSKEWLRQRARLLKNRWIPSTATASGDRIDFFESDRFDEAEVVRRTAAWAAILSNKPQPDAARPSHGQAALV